MNVLVTGGAGFIGSNLVTALCERGATVTVLDDLSSGHESNLDGTNARLVVGSLCEDSLVLKCMEDAETVVHLGARGSVPRSIAEPMGSHEINVNGTLNVLQGARLTGSQVIFSSSSSVYGANDVLPKKEHLWAQPISPYGASKLAAESYALAYREVYELDVLVFRFFNVYGPRQRADHPYAAVIPRFAWAALAGSPLVVHGDGEQTRDFTHVDSVVGVLLDAIDRRVSLDRPVNLAFGDRVTVNGVVAALEELLGTTLKVTKAPPRQGDVRDSRNDPARLLALFPTSAAPVGFKDGIASVVNWMTNAP